MPLSAALGIVPMKTFYTSNCIICGKTAVMTTGHVHKSGQIVTAGFCYLHSDVKAIVNEQRDPIPGCTMHLGCFGVWKETYGLQEEYRQLVMRPLSLQQFWDGKAHDLPRVRFTQSHLFMMTALVDNVAVKLPSEFGYSEYRRCIKLEQWDSEQIRDNEEL